MEKILNFPTKTLEISADLMLPDERRESEFAIRALLPTKRDVNVAIHPIGRYPNLPDTTFESQTVSLLLEEGHLSYQPACASA